MFGLVRFRSVCFSLVGKRGSKNITMDVGNANMVIMEVSGADVVISWKWGMQMWLPCR